MYYRSELSFKIFAAVSILFVTSCKTIENFENKDLVNPNFHYKKYTPNENDIEISRTEYYEKLYGFWLGQSIANWTGLITEMDKIGNIGEIKTGPFYTRDNWGKPDLPNIWNDDMDTNSSKIIDFVFRDENEIWGSDDDTDIEYMYQYLLFINETGMLTGEQIKEGWLKHIKSEEENFLWVSNQKAYDLMKDGFIPPQTGDPLYNSDYDMIDAQLTTEIFGLFAPSNPEIALKIANLPIQTTARKNAEWISEFYVIMHSLSILYDKNKSPKENILWMADIARKRLPENSYSAKMYDYVKSRYMENIPWEQVRDEVYQRYQVDQMDGYDITSRNMTCNGCFAAGINFASSIISLLYGEGDYKETIKIGVLAGWDADNPTSTWGGLLGFINGKNEIERIFSRKFSDKYNIHRTRQNFPNNGIDNFNNMAKIGIFIVDRVIQDLMNGGIDLEHNVWYIPQNGINVNSAE